MTERPCPEGWEQRDRLIPIGAPELVAVQILTEAVQRIADKVDGLDSADTNHAEYEAFCFPYDKAAWAAIAADQLSSCAVFGLAVADCLGVDAPKSDKPYAPQLGLAVANVVTMGRQQNAWVDCTVAGAEMPSGPFIALVGNNAGEGYEHVFVGLDGLDDDNECRVVEGGQVSLKGKGYRIAKGVYDFETRAPGQTWCRRIAPKANSWRRLRGYVDLTRCRFDQRATLPVELLGIFEQFKTESPILSRGWGFFTSRLAVDKRYPNAAGITRASASFQKSTRPHETSRNRHQKKRHGQAR